MERRQFVKAFLAASVSGRALLAQSPGAQHAAGVAPAAPPPTPPGAAPNPAPGPTPWMRGLLEVKPLPIGSVLPDAIASAQTGFFSSEQMSALRQLCELLLPPLKGYPGALDAGAPEFLDFLISVSPPDRQELYKSGLARLNRDAQQKFGVPFDQATPAQADILIRPALRTWMTDHPPTDPWEQFINLAHADIRTATVNSEPWNDADRAAGREAPGVGLYWYPIEADVEKKYLPHTAAHARARQSSRENS